MKNFDTLVLSGGGLKGIAILGSLQYLYDSSQLNHVKKYIGTSIGAIISVLLIIGYYPKDIIIFFIQNQILTKLPGYNIYKGIQGKGFLDYQDFEETLKKLIYAKLDTIPTFQELYNIHKKDLKIVTYNYTKKSETILSHETTSSLSILTGLRMSSGVPFIFDKFTYNGEFYFDGFITNNFPLNIVNTEEDCVLGINALQETWIEDDDSNILSSWKIFWNLFILPFYEIQILRNKKYETECTIYNIPMEDFSFLNFRLRNKELLDLFSIGYRYLKEAS